MKSRVRLCRFLSTTVRKEGGSWKDTDVLWSDLLRGLLVSLKVKVKHVPIPNSTMERNRAGTLKFFKYRAIALSLRWLTSKQDTFVWFPSQSGLWHP